MFVTLQGISLSQYTTTEHQYRILCIFPVSCSIKFNYDIYNICMILRCIHTRPAVGEMDWWMIQLQVTGISLVLLP